MSKHIGEAIIRPNGRIPQGISLLYLFYTYFELMSLLNRL